MTTVCSSLLLACLLSFGAKAQDVRERTDLGLVQRQIAAVEQLIKRASTGSVDSTRARYRFDYSKFTADLKLVHQGIQKYLSPSRAQPADLVELTGQYRTEAPHSSPSDEHD